MNFTGYPCYFCNGTDECADFCNDDETFYNEEGAYSPCKDKPTKLIKVIDCYSDNYPINIEAYAPMCLTKMTSNEVIFRGCGNGLEKLPPRGINQALRCKESEASVLSCLCHSQINCKFICLYEYKNF
jgi:hypothetical protein